MGHSNKKAKFKSNPKTSAEFVKNPDAFYSLYPSWKFNQCDRECWSLMKTDPASFQKILGTLISFEGQTWNDILLKSNNNNHPIKPSVLNHTAQNRLDELSIEAESIYSLRIDGTHRLYGLISDHGCFSVLWYDSNHGDTKNCVCRSHKKHT